MTHPLIEMLSASRIVAILRLDDLSNAESIVETLLAGGIRAIEFTLTNPEAPALIGWLRQRFSSFDGKEAAIGLGSVRNREEAKLAIEAGSQFVVCPITDIALIEYCRHHQTPVMPGAMTPTEIHQAWNAGADVVKLFPAGTLGPGYVKDVLAPMPYLSIMATGGVGLENMQSYFDAGAVAVGIGSSLIPKRLLENEDWTAIEQVAKQYSEQARIK